MPSLSRENRKLLENKVAAARHAAVAGAVKALTALRAGDKDSPADPDQKTLRNQLRAHGRQLGDARQADGTQETRRLEQACAYEYWHRMLFARFLSENDLLVNPDYGVAMSLAEIQETAREKGEDWISLASDYAQRMLLEVFRSDDPVLRVVMPPETRQELEELLRQLPAEIFTADDSLGWVYQFWQRDEKKRVNSLEVLIGAEEISPVTQLFTEDYMVLFLLHNTLGAWWANKRRAEGKTPQLPNYDWTYLRLNEDGSPAAGNFDDWPRSARDLRILDPCMGSGHFLTFALEIVARMLQEEEGLSLSEAVYSALADNLFGLELDARCSQIAAFNLALTAWRIVGVPMRIPSLNLACSGLGINAPKESWMALGGGDTLLRDTLAELFSAFQKAPLLGSLIDPMRAGRPLLVSKFDEVWPALQRALAAEQSSDDTRELAVAAKGVLHAAKFLVGRYTLVVTNVPYLGRYKQADELKEYCSEFFSDCAADLATCFVDRCLNLCTPGGTSALVTKDAPLFQPRYRSMRRRLLNSSAFDFVARLGTGAFETITGEVVSVALLAVSDLRPKRGQHFSLWDVSDAKEPTEKAQGLVFGNTFNVDQAAQLGNPDAIISSGQLAGKTLLSDYAGSFQGLSTADNPQFLFEFWSFPDVDEKWRWLQGAASGSGYVGGASYLLLWEGGTGKYYKHAMRLKAEGRLGGWKSGSDAWGKLGIAVNVTSKLAVNFYQGEMFDATIAVIVPADPQYLLPIFCYLMSPEYSQELKQVDQALSVTELTFLKVPFDLSYWQEIAAVRFPLGIPKPEIGDPSQWLFGGHPKRSNRPLQVAVARLLGYRWPRQTASAFPDYPPLEEDEIDTHAEESGIVCLPSISGELPAADRLRALLSAAYGSEWSAAKLAEFVGSVDSLEEWLRDRFFEEHCALFHSRPFIWHVWDGRKDGFSALVNYHKLAGPGGEGRKTLEKLIYTSLGDWIKRQRDEMSQGRDGAEGRLAAALHLHSQLENILEGQSDPERKTGYDIFIRWKPIHEQPIGWEPDLKDGVRPNMRPWLIATPYREPGQKLKQGACILRVTPIKLPFGKDRGKETSRDKRDFPWFATSQDRINDVHLTLEQKRAARERKKLA